MKRVISIISVLILIFALVSCSQNEDKNSISEVKVTVPCSTGAKAIVEGEAVIATQVYLLARAYFEKLETYDMDSFDAQEYSELLAENIEAFRIAEAFSDSLEKHAGALAETEENESSQQEKAKYELLSASTDGNWGSPFVTVAYAAEKSPAEKYAEELTKTFDNAKNGQKLKAVAEKYGTDIKKAKVMLEQAQAILEGTAYEDQATFENKCYEAAVETKAAASAIGFGVAFVATGGTAAGVMEVGGLTMSGVNAVIDMGTAFTIHTTCGEGNEYTAAWEKTAEMIAPINAVFAIGGGIQNIKDLRNPEKAAEAVNNAAQAFLTGVGFARDYVQDGTVLGVSSNIINGYREIIVRSADTSNPEAAKEVLLKTGINEEALEDEGSSEGTPQDGLLGTQADVYIEAIGKLVDPENPLDVDVFLGNVDDAFMEFVLNDGGKNGDMTETNGPKGTDENKPKNLDNNTNGKGALSAADVVGTYYFSEMENSTKISFSASDDSHLTMTDLGDGESFTGDYDKKTGVFHAVLSEQFRWYVTVKFTDTGHEIQAELEETVGDMSVTSLGMKE